MEDWPAGRRGQWGRVQLARYIIDYAGGHFRDMLFDEPGPGDRFRRRRDRLEALINSAPRSRPRGCPGKEDDCRHATAPMATPARTDILSFPFELSAANIARVGGR